MKHVEPRIVCTYSQHKYPRAGGQNWGATFAFGIDLADSDSVDVFGKSVGMHHSTGKERVTNSKELRGEEQMECDDEKDAEAGTVEHNQERRHEPLSSLQGRRTPDTSVRANARPGRLLFITSKWHVFYALDSM